MKKPILWNHLAMVLLANFSTTILSAAPGSASSPTPIDQPKWNVKTTVGPDAATGGWFLNLGRTGIRAKLLPESPTEFLVTYVFPDSPAAGVVRPGDRIVGAAGRPFETPHVFGYGVGKFGYDGPMRDLATAMEQAEAGLGRLPLAIVRDDRPLDVDVRIGALYGAFATGYPKNCDKTDRIIRETIPWIAERQRTDGLWSARPHLNAFAMLALLANDRPADREAIERAARAMAADTDDSIEYQGLDCWKYTLYGICLAEYHLATKAPWALDELREIDRWLRAAQMENGGWGHRPANRPGGNGYGAINILTMQAKIAWALMRECGVEIDEGRFRRAHDFVVRGTGRNGYVWYADSGRDNPGYADMGRTGAAALAHAIAAEQPEYRDYALRTARCIGEHPDTFSDTHGSPILGMVWTAFGAAADPEALRALLDENRWWFSLAHCPDGSFYYQMNRDNNPQDYTAAPRLSATAATALILSLRDRRLRMMNVEVTADPGASETGS